MGREYNMSLWSVMMLICLKYLDTHCAYFRIHNILLCFLELFLCLQTLAAQHFFQKPIYYFWFGRWADDELRESPTFPSH